MRSWVHLRNSTLLQGVGFQALVVHVLRSSILNELYLCALPDGLIYGIDNLKIF